MTTNIREAINSLPGWRAYSRDEMRRVDGGEWVNIRDVLALLTAEPPVEGGATGKHASNALLDRMTAFYAKHGGFAEALDYVARLEAAVRASVGAEPPAEGGDTVARHWHEAMVRDAYLRGLAEGSREQAALTAADNADAAVVPSVAHPVEGGDDVSFLRTVADSFGDDWRGEVVRRAIAALTAAVPAQPSAERKPVAFAIQLADGTIGAEGWMDMRAHRASREWTKLREGARYVYAFHGSQFDNAGDTEAQFVEDAERLNCPACGGSGHADDTTPTPAAQPSGESEQSIKADAYDMIAEALEKAGVRVSSVVDHVTGLIATPAAQPSDAVLVPKEPTKEMLAGMVASTFLSDGSELEMRRRFNGLLESLPAAVGGDAWQPISQAPSSKLCIVGWRDKRDAETPERHQFDFMEDGRWVEHDNCVEHAEAVAPAGSVMPSREPPYRWFMEIPALPAIDALSSTPAAVGGGAVGLIAAERLRQVSAEGWSAAHDDAYSKLELVRAAVAYALHGVNQTVVPESFWPWHFDWWKPSDNVRNLVKAGALIAAEIDRLKRREAIDAEQGDGR